MIERQIKELSVNEKNQQRQQRSLSVLNKLKVYIAESA
jgi:hypothetical protein